MSDIEFFIAHFPAQQQAIMRYFHDAFIHTYELTPKTRYNLPFYYGNSWICYLNPSKSNTVELAFTRGNELSDTNNLLSANGRKQVRSITYANHSEIIVPLIEAVIDEAIALDKTIPYQSKRR